MESIKELQQQIEELTLRLIKLEKTQIVPSTDPRTVKNLLNITKEQFIITANPTFLAPTGSIAIKPTTTKQIWVKTDTGWVQIV